MASHESRRTIFVRGVSREVDEETLQQLFGEVGPLRSCFLVKKDGQEKHDGYGFVQFALAEDAARAVEALSGHFLAGRRLQVRLHYGHIYLLS
jgi:nucleolar protein 4